MKRLLLILLLPVVALGQFGHGGSGGSTINTLGDVGDVNVAGISDGQTIQWQVSSSTWIPLTISGGGNVSNSGTPTAGQMAQWVTSTTIAGVTRTLTVAGTANEIASSAGAQDLSADRNWTISLPSALTFTGKTITGGTYTAVAALTGTLGRFHDADGDSIISNPQGFSATNSAAPGTRVWQYKDGGTELAYADCTGIFTAQAITEAGTGVPNHTELGTGGLIVQTSAGTYAQRTLTGDAEIVVANGNGVSGNPTLSIAASLTRDSEISGLMPRSEFPDSVVAQWTWHPLVTAVAGQDTVLIRDQTDNAIKKALLPAETDPNALLTAGTDNVKDTHIDWGTGAGQVSGSDLPNEDLGHISLTSGSVTVEDFALNAPASAGNQDVDDVLKLNFSAASELTIATGAITITQSFHLVDTEADAAADNLVTINGGDTGDMIFFRAAHTDRTVAFKHGTGNIQITGGADLWLDDTGDIAVGIFDGTNWILSAGNVGIGINGSALTNAYWVDTDSLGTETYLQMLKRVGNEAALVTAASTDSVFIIDVTDGVVKQILVSDLLGSGTDPDAIHDNVAAEISAVADKTAPVLADHVLIEDSEASDAKKDATIGQVLSAGNDLDSNGDVANDSHSHGIGSTVTGLGTGIAGALGTNVGSAGAPVLFNGAGGTPSAITLTNGTGLPLSGVIGGAAGANAYDFGGATSVEIPNGTNPTIDADGEIAYDTDEEQLRVFDGTNDRAIPTVQIINKTILYPDSVRIRSDDVILYHFPTEIYPFGVTVVYAAISASASASDTHVLEEWSDAVGTVQATIHSLALSTATKIETTTPTDGALAADSYININLDDATDNINWIEVTIGYYINPGD